MKKKARKSHRNSVSAPRPAAVAVLAGPGSFQMLLADCVRKWPEQRAAAMDAVSKHSKRVAESFLRVPAWLQARCAQTATKRLRVAETVSLGEKRFVALVSVGDREFLVGGGASGVSLLANLGAAAESQDIAGERHFE